MATPLDSLITDRTEMDVQRVGALTAALVAGTATNAERKEFLAGMKGAYNFRDLNRVEKAIEYLGSRLADESGTYVDIAPKMNWKTSDIPTADQMERYLQDIQNVRAALRLPAGTPEAPETLVRLTYSGANDIEKILLALNKSIDALATTIIMSNEVLSGEV